VGLVETDQWIDELMNGAGMALMEVSLLLSFLTITRTSKKLNMKNNKKREKPKYIKYK